MGRISKSLKAIVIDAGVGAHSGITYVAKFDENHYEVLPIDGKEDLFNEYVVESKDVNEDGIIEFVRTVRPKGWEDKPHGDSPLFERYIQWSESGIKPIEERYIDIEKGYYVKIPKELIGKLRYQMSKRNQILKSFWRQVQMKHGLKFICLSGKNGLE